MRAALCLATTAAALDGLFPAPLEARHRRIHDDVARLAADGGAGELEVACLKRLALLRALVAEANVTAAVDLSLALGASARFGSCGRDAPHVGEAQVLVRVASHRAAGGSNATARVRVGEAWLAASPKRFRVSGDEPVVGFALDGLFHAVAAPMRCEASGDGGAACDGGRGAERFPSTAAAHEAARNATKRAARAERGRRPSRFADTDDDYVKGTATILIIPACPSDVTCADEWDGIAASDGIGTYVDDLVDALNGYLDENSYGQFQLDATVTPTMQLAYSSSSCGSTDPLGYYYGDAYALDSMAFAAAEAYDATYAMGNYDYYAILPQYCSGWGWLGIAFVGVPGAVLNLLAYDYDAAFAHELGHNFGAYHASFDDAEGARGAVAWWDDGSSDWVEYANPYTVMGSGAISPSDTSPHYLGVGKVIFDWIAESDVESVEPHDSNDDGACAPCGPFSLQAIDDGSWASGVPGLLEIATATADRYLFVEYRSQFSGALLTWSDVRGTSSTTPSRDCSWVGNDATQRCANAKSISGVYARVGCPRTCGECACDGKPAATLGLRWRPNVDLDGMFAPVVLRGWSKTNNSGGNWKMTFDLHDGDTWSSQLSVPFSAGDDEWAYAAKTWRPDTPDLRNVRVALHAPCAALTHTGGPTQFAFVGAFFDPKLSCKCDTKYYLKNANGNREKCQYCPAASYCVDSVRYRCPEGEMSFGGSTACEPCRKGYVCENGIGVVCEGTSDFSDNIAVDGHCDTACPAGFECRAGVATGCALGKYAPENRVVPDHMHDCIPCDPGYFANETNSTACHPCPAGKTSKLGEATCFDCAAGEFVQRGAYPCASCPAGTWSPAGAGACTNCTAGRYAAEVGTNVACYACNGSTAEAATSCGA